MTKLDRFCPSHRNPSEFPFPLISVISGWAILTSRRAFPSIHTTLITVIFLLSAFSLLASAFSQSEPGLSQPQTSPSPTPSPSPSPSPSPTPVTGLHQWGAVTLFHGLPSDRVRAIAQGRDGAMWFGTEAGLAKFDGRRTQTITIPDLSPKILALQSDQWGGLWVGTETGAARM